MKKLNFLKALVDIVWIMTCVALPLVYLFTAFVFISNETLNIPIKINGTGMGVNDLKSKIVLFFLVISVSLLFYGLFLFKKLLKLFQQKIIFDSQVIALLRKLGYAVCMSSIIGGIASFIVEFWEQRVSINIGFNSFALLLSLGLFFLVLSEVFTTAKAIKEENDLTF